MSLFGGHADEAAGPMINALFGGTGAMPIDEVVRLVRDGDSGRWHGPADDANGLVARSDMHEQRSMALLQALESAWEGGGAEGAANSLRVGVKATRQASEAYQANARVHTENAHSFDNIKGTFPDIPDAPERGVVDVLTPWETDTEAQINEREQKLAQAKEIYDGFDSATVQTQQSLQSEYGELNQIGGGLPLGAFDRSPAENQTSGTGVVEINEPGAGAGNDARPVSSGPVSSGPVSDGSVSGGPVSAGPVSDRQVSGGPGDSAVTSRPDGPVSGPRTSAPGTTPDDTTGTSGHTSPDSIRPPAASQQSPGSVPANPGTSTGVPGTGSPGGPALGVTGGGTAGGAGGAGSRGGGAVLGGGRSALPGGGYSGGGSGAGAPGAGAGSGSGAGAPGAGKVTGTGGGLGATGAGGAGGAGTAATGARGGGMPVGGAMGGGAGRGGQGAEDEEHRRQYVVDTDEAFALAEDGEVLRDPATGQVVTPPTIGE